MAPREELALGIEGLDTIQRGASSVLAEFVLTVPDVEPQRRPDPDVVHLSDLIAALVIAPTIFRRAQFRHQSDRSGFGLRQIDRHERPPRRAAERQRRQVPGDVLETIEGGRFRSADGNLRCLRVEINQSVSSH